MKYLIKDDGRQCSRCLVFKPWDDFHVGGAARGRKARCKSCIKELGRQHGRMFGYRDTTKYEKTKKGFLMRLYRNMQSRVTGINRSKWHLYAGCSLLPRADFYDWALGSAEFHRLFESWELSNYSLRLTPSVDRLDSALGYELSNMEWVTQSENSRRGALNRHHGDWRAV